MRPRCPHCGKVPRRVPYDTPPDRLHQLYEAGWCPWVIGPRRDDSEKPNVSLDTEKKQ